MQHRVHWFLGFLWFCWFFGAAGSTAWSQELRKTDSGAPGAPGALLWKKSSLPSSFLSGSLSGLAPDPLLAKPAAAPCSELFAFDPRAEELAALVANRPPRIERSALDGASEAEQRFHGLPGGIVLGLPARPADELLGSLGGATLARDGSGRLLLRLLTGRALLLPALDPDELHSCLAFVSAVDASDALVDCMYGVTHLARAFEGTRLGPLLVGADQTPHRLFPESSRWKSLILDSEVSFEPLGDALLLHAALELRFYEEQGSGSGASARVLTLAVPAPGCACATRSACATLVGPTPACSGELQQLSRTLAPIAELAAWIGFLRWAKASDPAGFAALSR